jgi:DNA-binding HxlR family transcriptional regulator
MGGSLARRRCDRPVAAGGRTRIRFIAVLGRDYAGQNCSVSRTLEVVGERWTLLILREAFFGTRRFDDFQRNLGVARNVLQARLERLVDEGIMVRRRYSERPPRDEYRLTPDGCDLLPVMLTLMAWGDRHRAPAGPPLLVRHRECGGSPTAALECVRCGRPVTARDLELFEGPGATDGEGVGAPHGATG